MGHYPDDLVAFSTVFVTTNKKEKRRIDVTNLFRKIPLFYGWPPERLCCARRASAGCHEAPYD
jgi:hypothetical protein